MNAALKKACGLLETTAAALYYSACSSESKRARAVFERMDKPRVGDVVIELTTMHRNDGRERLGTLKSVSKHRGPIAKQWTIEAFDGAVVCWTNAKFIAIPEGLNWFNEASAL